MGSLASSSVRISHRRHWKPRIIIMFATCLVLSLFITSTAGILALPILKIKAIAALFRAGIGAVIGKRSVNEAPQLGLDDILKTDDGDCTKLLVCELAGEKNLSGTEKEIVSVFTSGRATLDPSVARTGYAVAAYIGGQYPGACERLYKKCDLKTGELRSALRS